MSNLHFTPNVPILLKLVDPEGEWDADMRQGTYQTTCGQTFVLPRPAVILLNSLEPQPGEEIQITRHWKGRKLDPITWTICLSPASEKARAAQEIAASESQDPGSLVSALQESIARAESQRPLKSPPTPIRKPAKRQTEEQPRLFDRGTGTDGPAPQPKPAPVPLPAVARKTPYGEMLRHIVRTVELVLKQEGVQLGDAPKQDLYSTVYIDAAKRSGVEYDFSDGRPE